MPVCVEHIPLLRSRCRVYLTQLPPGDSPPPAQKSPRAPCPLCQGEKAAEPETKKLLPPSTLRPSTRPRHSPAPSLDPGDTASAHARGRDQGTGNRVGESAFSTPRGYSCPCTPPGDTPWQPRPHHPLPKASRAPNTANPSPKRQHHPSSGATGGRGTHKADGESGAWGGEEEIPPELAARARGGYLPDFFFDLRDVCEDEEDHKQRERGQHPAPELQLHGGVGALRDPRARAGARSWG